MQSNGIAENLAGTEDCLVANVYVPDTRRKNLSVLVYVHGGGFVIGHGEEFTAKRLLETKDIVLVTFNYRLGAHGFLCLGTEDVPGNAGMKDQVALLRWVQKNIASYGGNPDDVTIEGFSAGSASVDLLMLSKLAEGLFHKVIPESGGNLNALQQNPLENAKYLARLLNFTNVDDIYALEKFYKTASNELLYSIQFADRTDSTYLFAPCLERDTEGEAFLTESPFSILQKGSYKKLPVLYGFAAMECLEHLDYFDLWRDKMNENFSDFLTTNLKFQSNEERIEVANNIKKFYFGNHPVSEYNTMSYMDYFSDVLFNQPMLWAVKLHAEAGNNEVYLYEYSFVDDHSPLVPRTNIRAADHCAQTLAVMDGLNATNKDENLASTAYRDMKKTIRQMWRNFIKTG